MGKDSDNDCNITQDLKQLEGIKHLLTEEEYATKRTQVLSQIGSSPAESDDKQEEEGPEEEKKTLVESMQDGSLLESAMDTVTDKKFLGGAGVGFIGGAIAGAGITHIVHKKKQKKEEEEEKQRKKQEKKDKKKKKKKNSKSKRKA